ncbi:unnamed protein product [Ixodes pacificus]
MAHSGASNAPDGNALQSTLAAVQNFRLPPFWPKNPTVWLMQVEAQFRLRHITSQETRYLHTVSSLPADVAEELADILATPDPVNPFDQLKAAILDRKTESERSRLQQLLNTEELGDRRPSQLLHRMRQLLGAQNPDPNNHLLRELFLQRLPSTMVPVLAAAEGMSLDTLAELADRVADYSRAPGISAVANGTPATTSEDSRLSRLEDRIEALSRQLATLAPLSRRRQQRSHSRRRPRSHSRSVERATSSNSGQVDSDSGRCWYHRTFGNRARKCTQPCASAEN